MTPERLCRETYRLGINLTEQQREEALALPNRKGLVYLREIASVEPPTVDPFVRDPYLWTRDEMVNIINSGKGISLRALDHQQKELHKVVGQLAATRARLWQTEQILREVEKYEPEATRQSKETVAQTVHPQQLRLFDPPL